MFIGFAHTLVPFASLEHKRTCQANNHGWQSISRVHFPIKSHYCTMIGWGPYDNILVGVEFSPLIISLQIRESKMAAI